MRIEFVSDFEDRVKGFIGIGHCTCNSTGVIPFIHVKHRHKTFHYQILSFLTLILFRQASILPSKLPRNTCSIVQFYLYV